MYHCLAVWCLNFPILSSASPYSPHKPVHCAQIIVFNKNNAVPENQTLQAIILTMLLSDSAVCESGQDCLEHDQHLPWTCRKPIETAATEVLTTPSMIPANSVSKALAWAKLNQEKETDAKFSMHRGCKGISIKAFFY